MPTDHFRELTGARRKTYQEKLFEQLRDRFNQSRVDLNSLKSSIWEQIDTNQKK